MMLYDRPPLIIPCLDCGQDPHADDCSVLVHERLTAERDAWKAKAEEAETRRDETVAMAQQLDGERLEALEERDAALQRAEVLERTLEGERLNWKQIHDGCHAERDELRERAEAAERKLADATAYCSGEFPCEASTAAASLELQLRNVESALIEAERERDEAIQEKETEYGIAHALEIERNDAEKGRAEARAEAAALRNALEWYEQRLPSLFPKEVRDEGKIGARARRALASSAGSDLLGAVRELVKAAHSAPIARESQQPIREALARVEALIGGGKVDA